MSSTGATLIAVERERQVTVEGFTSAHDDTHFHGELSRAGVCYIENAGCDPAMAAPMTWPWEDSYWKPTGDRVGDLVKGGALVAAEIDRMARRG